MDTVPVGPVATTSRARPVALGLLVAATVAFAVWRLGVAWGLGLSLLAYILVTVPRTVRTERLTELCFLHVKDTISATELHALRPALRRQRLDLFRRDLDPYLHGADPPWRSGPPKPGRFVTLKVAPTLWPRLRHVRAVTVRWAPLVPDDDRALLDRLRTDVADFLGVDRARVSRGILHPRRGRVTFTLPQ